MDDNVAGVNQMKTRLAALGTLDRAFAAATDEDLAALVAGLHEEHTEALVRLCGDTDVASLRETVRKGRIDGQMVSLAILLTDTCLADCIEQLGENADNPDGEQLAEVLPGLVERHGVAATRIMLGATLAGEAPAAPIIREVLRSDEVLALPKVESSARPTPAEMARTRRNDDPEREALRARRRETRAAERAEAAARREQSRRDRGRI